jgi:hypothetical protein
MISSKGLLLTAAFCVLLTSICLACGGERFESLYPSLADAEKDGAVIRGWIPDFLPESSRAIHELHRISGGKTWCAFEFVPGDSGRLRKNVKNVDVLPASVRRILDPGVSWWPTVLVGNLDVEEIHRLGIEPCMVVTPGKTEVLLFMVDWPKGRGFFYRAHE